MKKIRMAKKLLMKAETIAEVMRYGYTDPKNSDWGVHTYTKDEFPGGLVICTNPMLLSDWGIAERCPEVKVYFNGTLVLQRSAASRLFEQTVKAYRPGSWEGILQEIYESAITKSQEYWKKIHAQEVAMFTPL